MTLLPAQPIERAQEWAGAVAVASAWAVLYGWRAYTGHASLQTNAYDLSVFDYALWNTVHGRVGFVPFFGYTIFAQHFMPVLFLLAPVYALWPSPNFLIAIQTAAVAGASLLFFGIARRFGLAKLAALALMIVLLLSRRSHSAAVSYFYPECLQPALMFAMILAWMSNRQRAFWIATILLLTTKEDMPLYVGAFAALQWRLAPAQRPRALALAVVAAVWLAAGFGVAIPLVRHWSSLSAANPFFEARVGATAGGATAVSILAGHLLSVHSVGLLLALFLSVGFLPLLAPAWLLVAAPAVLVSLSLSPTSEQATLMGHYAWPVLPWVFLSSAAGAVWLQQHWPRTLAAILLILVSGTLADAPVVRNVASTRLDPAAAVVLHQLPDLEGSVIAVQANLLPHVPHDNRVRTIDRNSPLEEPDEVLLTTVGDLWPLTQSDVETLITHFQTST